MPFRFAKKTKKEDVQSMSPKLSLKFKGLWATGFISVCAVQAVMNYVQIFATDYLGLSVTLFGTLIMCSKFFDAFTDAVGGILVDKTHSKIGKGRPYDLALIGYWVCIILIFCPPHVGTTGKLIYVVVMYTLANAVFATLYNCGNTVYLANALDDQRQSVSAVAFAGVLGTFVTTIIGVILPQMIESMGEEPNGWLKIGLYVGIPMIVLGSLRFIFIKEKRNTKAATETFTIKEMFLSLAKNKIAIIIAAISLLNSIGINLYLGVSGYYCKYIMGDFGLSSIISLTLLAIVFLVMAMPALAKRFGLIRMLKICAIVGAGGFLLKLLNISSVPLLITSSLISTVGFYAFNSFVPALLIDSMDYGEWKNRIRCEGSITAANSLAGKVGTAVGMGLVGVLLGLAKYDGILDVQPQSANSMIIALYTWIPAAFCIIEYILFRAYDIEGKLPEIRAELAARHGAEK